jgi:hypothetical protein
MANGSLVWLHLQIFAAVAIGEVLLLAAGQGLSRMKLRKPRSARISCCATQRDGTAIAKRIVNFGSPINLCRHDIPTTDVNR